jgi:hypothetical protein
MLVEGLRAFPVMPAGLAEQLARASSAFNDLATGMAQANATAQKLAQAFTPDPALRAALDKLAAASRTFQPSPTDRACVFLYSVNRRGRRVTHNGITLDDALGRVSVSDLDDLTAVLYGGRVAIADALASEWAGETAEVRAVLLVMLSILDDLDALTIPARAYLSTCRPNRQTRRAKKTNSEPQGHRHRTPQPRAVCAHHRRRLATVSTNDDPADSLSSLGAMSPHHSKPGGK